MTVRKTLLVASLVAALGAAISQGHAQDQTQGKTDASGADATAQQPQTPPPPPNLGPRNGGAQQQAGAAPAQPNVETVATHNGWIVQCGDVPTQDGQKIKACGMTRTGTNEKEQKVGVTIIVKRLKGPDGKFQTMMDAWAPIGVYLPTGVAMEIDGTALEGRMSFTRCLPQACNAFGEASDVTLKKFTKGKQIIFYVYDRPGNGYPIKFPLAGFADGVADLDKYAPTPPAAPAAAPAPAPAPDAKAAAPKKQ